MESGDPCVPGIFERFYNGLAPFPKVEKDAKGRRC